MNRLENHERREASYRSLVMAAIAATAFNVAACGGSDGPEDNPNVGGSAGMAGNAGEGGTSGKGGTGGTGGVEGGTGGTGGTGGETSCDKQEFKGLAFMKLNPGQKGSVTVELGNQHADKSYNGTKLTMVSGEVLTKASIVGLQKVVYDNYQTPGYGTVGDVSGLRPVVLDAEHPYVDDGNGNCKLNLAPVNSAALADIAKQPTIESPNGIYATVLKLENNVEAIAPYSLQAQNTRFSLSSLTASGRQADFLMANSKPSITASAVRDVNGFITIDLTGTTDEGDGSANILSKLNASAAGVTFEAVAGQPGKFRTKTPSNLTSLNLAVAGTNQGKTDDTSNKSITVTEEGDGGTGGTGGTGGADGGTGGAEAGAGGTGGTDAGTGGVGGSTGGTGGTGGIDAGTGGIGGGGTGGVGGTGGAEAGAGGTGGTIDPCATVNCNGHGTCVAGACDCTPGFANNDANPKIDCDACDTGYTGYPNCVNLPPELTGLGIDCSSTSGYCGAGETYPVTFDFKNATSYTTSLELISGSTTLGSIDAPSGTLTGSSKTFNYALGNNGLATVRLTVTTSGPGGQKSEFIDIDYY